MHVQKSVKLRHNKELYLDKNLSKLSGGMLRQGILNSHNDFV